MNLSFFQLLVGLEVYVHFYVFFVDQPLVFLELQQSFNCLKHEHPRLDVLFRDIEHELCEYLYLAKRSTQEFDFKVLVAFVKLSSELS